MRTFFIFTFSIIPDSPYRIESAAKIRNRDEFRAVGHHLYGMVRQLLADEVAATLKHLCRLKVPADSKLVQAVLQVRGKGLLVIPFAAYT